jgi:hypothetical protein
MRIHLLSAVSPDYAGMPQEVRAALIQVTNNAAAALILISGLGLALSLLGLVCATWAGNRQLTERCAATFVLSIGALALLSMGVATANYTAGLFS